VRLAELLVALCVAVMATSVAAADLLPRPDAAAVKASKAEVRDIFKADYADADLPSEKAKLAREFLRIAADTSKESDRFALLVLARDLAIDGRDRERPRRLPWRLPSDTSLTGQPTAKSNSKRPRGFGANR